MAHTTKTNNLRITYVGESRGNRDRLRRIIARHYGIALSHVEFYECRDYEADSEIARLSIGWTLPNHKNLTALSLGSIDEY